MQVTEAVTDLHVCSHCRSPWTAPDDVMNGCCDEDAETAPTGATGEPVIAWSETIPERMMSNARGAAE